MNLDFVSHILGNAVDFVVVGDIEHCLSVVGHQRPALSRALENVD